MGALVGFIVKRCSTEANFSVETNFSCVVCAQDKKTRQISSFAPLLTCRFHRKANRSFTNFFFLAWPETELYLHLHLHFHSIKSFVQTPCKTQNVSLSLVARRCVKWTELSWNQI